jgi:hypothetical protein
MAINVYPPYGSNSDNPIYASFGGNSVDSFGRLRVSNPYTLFDSQSRYAADPAYNYVVSGTGASAWQSNKSAVNLSVSTTTGSAVAQTYRSFPYQPGKSLLTLQTFTMAPNTSGAGVTQRVGFFNTANGIYLEQSGSSVSLNIRSASGSGNQQALQASWNVDKFDGNGPSGVSLDLTKTQIFWIDIEWLGVGSVRSGFVINGIFYTAHIFNNANIQSYVYMTTAILPLRFEITTTGGSAATLQQICSSVISEGGYEQTSQVYNARQATLVSSITTTFVPLVSIRLNSSYLGSVVIPSAMSTFPVANGSYEFAIIKNATLTGATYASGNVLAAGQVDVDLAATSMTYTNDNIVQQAYANASNQSTTPVTVSAGYNWDLQLGVSQANVSDTYTVAARLLTGTGGSAYGTLSFYNLTA